MTNRYRNTQEQKNNLKKTKVIAFERSAPVR